MNADYFADFSDINEALCILYNLSQQKASTRGDPVLDFKLDRIDIMFNGVTVDIASKDKGSGRARVNSGFLRYLSSVTPRKEKARIWVEGGMLHLDNFSVDGDWADIAPKLIEFQEQGCYLRFSGYAINTRGKK